MPRTNPLLALNRDSEPHILIVRLGAIGDVMMASPVPQVLREHFPKARITWLVEPLASSLVRINPDLDEVIVFEQKKQWLQWLREGRILNTLREVRQFRRELHARKFDIAIDLQGLFKSGLMCWLSGAPVRLGPYSPKEAGHLLLTHRVPFPSHCTRLSEGYLSILKPLGIDVTARRLVLPIPEEERAVAREFLHKGGIESPYAVCCISSSRPQKDWVWTRWRELADQLWEREGVHTVFVGGPERRVDAMRLVEGAASKPLSAVGALSLLQSCAIVQDAAVVIGCDTGLTYAGLATDTPTVALYGSTSPLWLAEEPCVEVCFHLMPCAPCRRRPTCQHYDCMQAITVDEVAATAAHLLKRNCLTA
jgi:heptosyltransferase-1